eukprot:TRINITY_DN6331_c0_g1_i1.p1 TRINITY_DN6331_c0_g1~~TRINITY_DN6331_c0_g1_i1.p1  ORF type:complete len:318 (+),score=57.22 TRINITY_DN6331_c0_g1_i1:114-1067(+)
MAEQLANIFCTEKDKVNCPFFFKIGACRHGDKCSRIHHRPTISQTLLLSHLYANPFAGLSQEQAVQVNQDEVQEQFEVFYEDIFSELAKFGEVEELNVCENLGDHMVGNVYAKFVSEDSAGKALQGLNGRFYAGRPVLPEYSPVTDFREARCRQFDMSECTRGSFCNFMHLKRPSKELQRELFRGQPRDNKDKDRIPDDERERDVDHPTDRDHDHDHDRDRDTHDRDRYHERDHRDNHERDRDRDHDRHHSHHDDRRDRDRRRDSDRGSRSSRDDKQPPQPPAQPQQPQQPAQPQPPAGAPVTAPAPPPQVPLPAPL